MTAPVLQMKRRHSDWDLGPVMHPKGVIWGVLLGGLMWFGLYLIWRAL